MDRDRLAQALMATFLEELEEHVAALNRDLLALEKAPSPAHFAERMTALLRTVHSVKGASRAVSVGVIETACHWLEEVLMAVQRLGHASPELMELCFTAADALDDAGRRLAQKQDMKGSPLEALLPRLEEAARAPGSPPARAPVPETPPPAPPESAAPATEGLPVRVSAQKLDALLSRSGELRVAGLRLESRVEMMEAVREELHQLRLQLRGADEAAARRLEKRLAQLGRALAVDGRALLQATGGLDEEVRRARTLPFAEACAGLERNARDLAHASGKQVRLEVHGGALELDRSLLQGLREPLLHLVRNAVAHGVETPAARRSAGKPEEGRVTLTARLRGGRVQVVVEDDGRGLDLDTIRERARALGLTVLEDAGDARLIFMSGLSTAESVTAVSGRGVGLDVVRSQVEALRGSVDVAFEPGQGTRFILDVPLTLSTLRVLLVTAGGQTFAVAGESVERLLRLEPGEVRVVEGRQLWVAPRALVPLATLTTVLGLPASAPRPRPGAMVLASGELRAVLVVEEVLAEQEVLIRGLGPRIRRARHVSGMAVLPDGRMAPLLNAPSLVRAAEGRTAPAGLFPSPVEKKVRKRVLLVDDSMTTRALEQSILEAAGYDVLACVDGQEGWERLQAEGADAVVSDVEMPRMDGFALTEAVRGSPRFGRLPVVLVTARSKPEDKARGLQVGASAYLVKSAFDQTHLLETLRHLL
ncbi:response regulator [Vitiosangium sp. GDMCC 1.1324]|uniref:hybrid sensor histidine kinase/response regulator n=1 Tax=Vitiosangium sp. (strain GDMCC 1.1324) TaxID=2138576 RepID=UPI000D370265|nr:response regulator [Vitiosangium sp. GDMCC 1.1324]PTL83193.1 hybrid sensor histidine kinase/response regulator [Vitiosangium sp. GDMCC 1.1324]